MSRTSDMSGFVRNDQYTKLARSWSGCKEVTVSVNSRGVPRLFHPYKGNCFDLIKGDNFYVNFKLIKDSFIRYRSTGSFFDKSNPGYIEKNDEFEKEFQEGHRREFERFYLGQRQSVHTSGVRQYSGRVR